MKRSSVPVLAAARTAFAAVVASVMLSPTDTVVAVADQNAAVRTNPGFNPDTGQINKGVPQPVPSDTAATRIPTPAEARAAFMSSEPTKRVEPATTGSAAGP